MQLVRNEGGIETEVKQGPIDGLSHDSPVDILCVCSGDFFLPWTVTALLTVTNASNHKTDLLGKAAKSARKSAKKRTCVETYWGCCLQGFYSVSLILVWFGNGKVPL